VRGEPILYGMSVPRAAPHPASANRFVAYLFSPGVLKQLRDAHVDMVANPVVHGSGAPASLRGGDGR
jgi:hypothetical protein